MNSTGYKNKSYLKTFIISTLLGVGATSAYAAEQPNIIYILADDMGMGDTSAYNANSKIATPSLDRLANEGIRFTNVHTSSSVCTPTRYGILTGRYAWRTSLKWGVTQGHSPHLIDPERETVASLLQKQGYDTAAVGKWHLGMDWASTDNKKLDKLGRNVDFNKAIKNGPNANGFDYYYGISASLNMNPHVFIENENSLGDMVFLKDAKAVKNAGLVQAKAGWMAKDFTQDQVQTTFVNKTISWIKQQQKSNNKKPFFVYLPLNSPHSPIVPSIDFIGKSGLSPHGDFTMEMDHQIGRLLTALDEMKLAENTLVIFTADNGVSPMAKLDKMQAKGHYSSMEYRGLKGSLYEGGHRVPFIVRWPEKIKANTQSDFHASTLDLLATIADITGVELADNVAEDSVSMKPALLGQAVTNEDRGIVYHSDAGHYAITQGKWKLILHHDGGTRRHNPKDKNSPVKNTSTLQLFNMEKDPTERVNVQAQYPERADGLKLLLTRYIQQGRSTKGLSQKNDEISEKTNKRWLQKLEPISKKL
jgi:arylsulfatase A-like enzyme